MYAPDRSKSSYQLQEWASAWLARDGGWESRVYELAEFCPLKYKELCRKCTYLDIAKAWKTKMALSEFAYTDTDARSSKTTWM